MTVRSDNPETRTILLDSIDRVAKGVALSLGVPEDLLPIVKHSPTETTPPTINDADTANYLRDVFTRKIAKNVLLDTPRQGMEAEDFAYFVEPKYGVRGVYFGVGGTQLTDLPKAASHHSPYFKVEPEPSIKLGTEAMVLGALAIFNKDD